MFWMFGVVPYFFVYQFFVGTSGGQVPLSIPPQPEMSVMSQVAPEECVFYVSFSGVDKTDPKAANLTEQFMAQPSTQALVQSMDVAILKAINKGETPKAGSASYNLVKLLLTCPWCAYASDLEFEAAELPSGKFGMMVYLGDQKEVFEKNLTTLLKEAELLEKMKTVTIQGKTFRQCPLDERQTLTWGILPVEGKPMLLAGVGDGAIEAMLRRVKTPAPAWLTDMKKKLPIQRRATVSYINIKKMREAVLPLFTQGLFMPNKAAESILDMLGLGNAKAFMASTGLDETGMVDHLLLETEGPPKGFLAAVVDSSLTAEDLAAVPADANILVGVKVDSVKIYTAIGEMLERVEPEARLHYEMSAKHAADATGFRSFKELLQSFGKTWTFYNSPAEGGPLFTGFTISVEVNDSFTQFRAAIEMIFTIASQNDPDAPRLVTKKYRETEISYLNLPHEVPVVPSWCVKDGRLFLSLTPQNIRTILDRDKATFRSIATVPKVAKALAQDPAPTALMYSDPKSLLKIVYPMIPYFAQSGSKFLRKADIDTDLLVCIPSLPSILPYAKPTLRTLRQTDSGVEFKAQSTLPGPVFTSSTLAAYAGAAIPLGLASKAEERQKQSMNNMKQIGLAIQNYASAHGTLPPAYTVDKNGKPLLSWRVGILPYIEENNLYKQFHLDEPWDSPHNKKLIPLMPEMYQSPKSKAGEGKANYLTIRTEKSVFPGKEKIKFKDLTDGASNTAILVEVDDAAAVPWTKPDDFVPGKKDPTKGLAKIHNGKFIAGFCDGSVHKISPDINKKILQSLFTRDGGEVIDHDALE